MKKFLLSLVFLAAFWNTASADDLVTRDVAQLPAMARTLLQKHFKEHKVSYIKIDKEFFDTEYKAVLTNGYEVEFDEEGNWTEIDCKKGVVPPVLIPTAVKEYLLKNFPGDTVEKIKRTKRRVEVELNAGFELEFDKNGELVDFDD